MKTTRYLHQQELRLLTLKAEPYTRHFPFQYVEQTSSLPDVLPRNPGSVVLAFGPEGGWKEEELAAFGKAGWVSASLGPAILRAETAAIAAVAVTASILNQ